MSCSALPVPSLYASRWFNTPEPIALHALRGRVVAIHTFQMLCPACVVHGLPQATRLREAFDERQLVVIGLHTVFEHHDVMGPNALEAFIHEYRLRLPIAVDEPEPRSPIPKTMAAWALQGTPSLVLLDRQGQVQLRHFGRIDDMALGAVVGQLLERPFSPEAQSKETERTECCTTDACGIVSKPQLGQPQKVIRAPP